MLSLFFLSVGLAVATLKHRYSAKPNHNFASHCARSTRRALNPLVNGHFVIVQRTRCALQKGA
jgi:hypothetical protein